MFNFFIKILIHAVRKKYILMTFSFLLIELKIGINFMVKMVFIRLNTSSEKDIIKNLKLILDFIYEKNCIRILLQSKFGKKNKNLLSFPGKAILLP